MQKGVGGRASFRKQTRKMCEVDRGEVSHGGPSESKYGTLGALFREESRQDGREDIKGPDWQSGWGEKTWGLAARKFGHRFSQKRPGSRKFENIKHCRQKEMEECCLSETAQAEERLKRQWEFGGVSAGKKPLRVTKR